MESDRRTFIAALLTLGPPRRPESQRRPPAPPARVAAPSLRDVIARAAEYVAAYDRDLGSVIAEEVYQQDVTLVASSDPETRLRAGPSEAPVLRRVLRSEFLLLRPTGITDLWRGFRDVIEVDGRAASDRANIQARFTTGGDLGPVEVRRLIDASARYNIGALTRNLNVPTFTLLVVHPGFADRFAFEKHGEAQIGDVRAWLVAFRERERPTLIRDLDGSSMPATGTLWVDPASGRVLRTELSTDKPKTHLRARILVTYQPDAKLGQWVPREMTEDYHAGRLKSFDEQTIHCVASYSNYRRFEVSVRIRP